MSTNEQLISTAPIKPKAKGRKFVIANAVMSLGFFGLFFAFNTVQAFQSQINETLGYINLGCLYGVFTLAAIFGPKIIDLVSPKWAMVGGGVLYVLVMIANVVKNDYFLVAANALCGFGAAIIWNGEGVYIGRCALSYSQENPDCPPESSTSMFNGRFFAVMQFTGTAGTLVGSLIMSLTDDTTIMFVVMCGAAVAGIGALFFLPDVPAPEYQTVPKRVGLTETLTLVWRSRIIQLMIPVILLNGMSLGFMFSDFMKFIAGKVVGVNSSGFIISTFYAVNSFASYFYGSIAATSFGRRGLCMIASICCTIFFVILIFIAQPEYNPTFMGYFSTIALCCLFGLGDAVWESQIPAILQSIYDDDVDINAAVSNYKMWQSLGFTIQFVLGILLKTPDTFYIKALILAILQVVSSCFLFYLHYKVVSLDKSSPVLRQSLQAEELQIPGDL